MSVYPDDPMHFQRWLLKRLEAGEGGSEPYPNRFVFGTYMDELVRGTAPAHPDSALRHRRARVASIARIDGTLEVSDTDGTAWWATTSR